MAKRICKTKYCKREARKGRTICSTCDKRIWRKNNPLKACFQTLRQNARRRGKEFELTIEQFEKFCFETFYIAGKGRKKQHFSIDRIDNNKGYTVDNIGVLTKTENSKKSNKILSYDWRTGYATVI